MSLNDFTFNRRKAGRPKLILDNKVEQVLSLYLGGLGYRAITRELEQQGILVTCSTVRRVIKSLINQ